MKLTELDPHWTCDALGRHGQGLSFKCPIHRDHRLAVAFANPVDGAERMKASGSSQYYWQRAGETWETLTLGPSINASGNKADVSMEHEGHIQTPCWHGFITNGEVT
jgi:hypothetical protein